MKKRSLDAISPISHGAQSSPVMSRIALTPLASDLMMSAKSSVGLERILPYVEAKMPGVPMHLTTSASFSLRLRAALGMEM